MAEVEATAGNSNDGCKSSVDRISNLPLNVANRIQQCLNLKEAVRMSILSTHWRYNWALLPRVILDQEFFRSVLKKNSRWDTLDGRVLEYSCVVNNILLRHDGPIHKFVLHIPDWLPEVTEISHWIHSVSGKFVRELNLFDGRTSAKRKLPSWMFTGGFNHLTHLSLIHWILPSLLTTRGGFLCLISLQLHTVHNTKGEASKIGILVSKCPLLESLDLKIHEEESCLTIHAPKLQNLVVVGCLSGIYLEETQGIKMLTLEAQLDYKGGLVMELFNCLPLVEKLVLGTAFWRTFFDEVGQPFEKLTLPSKLRELKNLRLYQVPLRSQLVISLMLCLLQMAPNLQKLEIKELFSSPLQPAPSNITFEGDCHFDHLKSTQILCSGDRVVLQLIRRILSSSPVLDVMSIHATKQAGKELKIAKELLRYRRASANAEIIFETDLY